MKLPDHIKPSSVDQIQIAPGVFIDIPKAIVTFSPWSGKAINDNYNGKQIVNSKGKPAFAELAILWAMKEEDWDGVWIDTYRRKYRTGYWGVPPLSNLPPAPGSLLEKIYSRVGSRSGAWDIYCWKGQSVRFLEAKRLHKDSIRETQRRFLKAGMEAGLTPENFLVVEWSLKGPIATD